MTVRGLLMALVLLILAAIVTAAIDVYFERRATQDVEGVN